MTTDRSRPPGTALPEAVETAIRPIRTDLAVWMPVDNREAWADTRCDTLRAAICTALAEAREEGADEESAKEIEQWQEMLSRHQALRERAERLRSVLQKIDDNVSALDWGGDRIGVYLEELQNGDLADDLQSTQGGGEG